MNKRTQSSRLRPAHAAHRAAAFAILLSASQLAMAQEEPAQPNEFEVKLSLEGTWSDNFYYEDDGSVTQHVAGSIISPVVEYNRASSAVDFGLTAKGEIATFSNGQSDNYGDTLASATVNFKLPSETILGLNVIGQYDHDPFGTERTLGQPSSLANLDEWLQIGASVALIKNQPQSAKFGYELKAGSLQRTYKTNTASTQFLDRKYDNASATLFFHLSPKFAALAQISAWNLEYDNVAPGSIDRSADSYAGLLGVKWSATAKTSGDVRVGRGKWQPDQAQIDDFDSSYWQVGLTWNASKKTIFRATTGREYKPTYRFDAAYINEISSTFLWKQLWTYKSNTTVLLGNSIRNFVGIPEELEYVSALARYEYNVDREMRFYISYNFLLRDPEVQQDLEFDANGAIIGFEVKLN